MITVDFLISFGYGRKHYNELRKERVDRRSHSKDDINRMVDFQAGLGLDPKEVREALQRENAQIREQADEWARGIIQIIADGCNRQGLTEDQVREQFKS